MTNINDSALIQSSSEGAVTTITLNRPEKLNALTVPMMMDLQAALRDADDDADCRVVCLRSASTKAFCAGADIGTWSQMTSLQMWREWIRLGNQTFDLLEQLRQPTLAVLRGVAFGGGLELALACDMRISNDTAKFALPEVTLGTIPGWCGGARLQRLVGSARAKQMTFTGEPIEALRALEWGLVNEVATDTELDARCAELVERIVSNAPVAVQAAKQLLNAGDAIDTAGTLCALASAMTTATEDSKHGTDAFLRRRTTTFKGV